ncbi:WcaI family glycosyltransferase [Sphingomonas sp. Y38-1Y]|uniref:WcaI family glycosyltransferase n=1 Tax=Sphingomonas sp. Y38-1Y TaxID=3078265 RepID=UPI0028E9B343|nr:WcaI family glycosyltransferase [Sphingomonas sp. Y38-1Y]
MNILILGLNYAPELVGTGPRTAGMARHLVEAGHRVTVVCGKPYFPEWRIDPSFAARGPQRSVEDGVEVVRVDHFVPRKPRWAGRLRHYLSFVRNADAEMRSALRRSRPDAVIVVAPTILSIWAARRAATRADALLWLHVQDFELDAAFATGTLRGGGIAARVAHRVEARCLRADRVSTISPQMCDRLLAKGVPADRIVELRNWADDDAVAPLDRPSTYRTEWGIERRHVALYSGSFGGKQGIEIIVEAARRLAHRRDLMFVICGDGPARRALEAGAADLDNLQFHDLQPLERLSDLLGLASVHLLPQIAGAADLVLPSKLANMLASGRPVIATAATGTGLAREVEECGVVTPPGDLDVFVSAIEALIDGPAWCGVLGEAGRRRAETRWRRASILNRFEAALRLAVAGAL